MRCMRSDGLSFPGILKKYHCNLCGMLFQLDNDNFSSSIPYRRSNGRSESDIKRHNNISQGICKLIKELFPYNQCLKILEIGAGNFLTSQSISDEFPHCFVTAIEPSPENGNTPPVHNLTVLKENLEDHQISNEYDLIFSNHVLEHLSDLKKVILQLHNKLLKKNGVIFFVVPNSYPASEEILFTDHLYTFTRNAMTALLDKSDMCLVCNFEADWDPASMVYVVAKKDCTNITPTSYYMRTNNTRIQGIDSILQSRLGVSRKWSTTPNDSIIRLDRNKHTLLFGAGEYAQLLSCYFPELYEIVESHIVSSIEGIRSFPKQVFELHETSLLNKQVILAVKPSSSRIVIQLLSRYSCANIIEPPTYS